MRYIIYKITNNINGKIYIGKHKTNNIDDKYFGSGLALKHAIKKYGKENFIFHLEFELHNEEEMNLLEKYVVNEEFLKRSDVYNLKEGGESGFLSLQSRKKMSEALKGRTPWNKGKTGIYTDETKQKMSKAKTGYIPWNKGVKGLFSGERSPLWGKHHSEESKRKMRKPKSEIGKLHMSQAQKGKKLSEEHKLHISVAMKGEKNHMYGIHLTGEKNGMYGKHHSEESKRKMRKAKIKSPILQYTLDFKFVAEYESISEAERKTGVAKTNISSCCKGKYYQLNGYIWVYKDDICYFF